MVALQQVHKLRQKFVDVLREKFADYGLTYAIGGKISFDIFPPGWDKTFCLGHVADENFEEIHFFGDSTHKVSAVPLKNNSGNLYANHHYRAGTIMRFTWIQEPLATL